MRGSVKKDVERGTWYYVVDIKSPDGNRRQLRKRGFPTKAEASTALAAVVADNARGTFVRPTRSTLRAFLVDEWLPSKAPTLKPSTAQSYRQMSEVYVIPRIGGCELARIDGGTLNALYAELLANGRTGASGARGGLSPKSVRNVHGMLHRAFQDAVRWRRLNVNPCDAADQPRSATPEMKVWTTNQLGRFVAAAEGERLAVLWRLLGTTGMRRGEVLGLRWSDIDLNTGRATVRQTRSMVGSTPEVGTPKSVAGNRVVALDEATIASVKRWRKVQAEERLVMGEGWQGGHDLIATEPDGTPVHPQVLTRRFHALTKAASVPTIRLHDVRHSYATAALGAGVPVKVLSTRLGHADVGVTLRVYAHVLPGDDEAAAAVVAAALSQSVTNL